MIYRTLPVNIVLQIHLLNRQLVKTRETGVMENVDVHPPFRSLLKHKAFLSQWMADHMREARHAL